jgi:lysophospholipase
MNLTSIAANPVPAGAVTGQTGTADGRILRFAHWPAIAGRKGTVCLLQGRAEFIEKYFETIGELRARGFAVATFDWRGQGGSQRVLADPRKGHVESFAEYDRDLAAFMRGVVLPDCPPPYFALAHSMGGAVLLGATAQGHRWFERIVLTAPMLGLCGAAAGRWAPPTARFLRLVGGGESYVPGGGATSIFSLPFEGNVLTGDRGRYQRTNAVIEAQPSLALGAPTVAWLDAAYRTMRTLADPGLRDRIRTPMLAIAAGADTVVSTPAIERVLADIAATACLVIAGARHEVLMERNGIRAQFWAAFDAFLPGSAFTQVG